MSLQDKIAEQRQRFFPMKVGDGAYAHPATFEEFMAVTSQMWGDVFGPTNENLGYYRTPEARRDAENMLYDHYRTTSHHEFLVIKDESGRALGWFTGESEDYTTFYLRNGGLVPGVRGQGFLRLFLPGFLAYLRELGYERITSEHHANNPAVLIAMLKNGFYIMGLNLDERYGPLLKLVRFLHDDRKQSYASVFRLPSFDPVAPSKREKE